MSDRRTLGATSLFVWLLAAASAGAVPLRLTHHGHLTQGGNPVQGQIEVTFRLYDGLAASAALWEESVQVICSAGYYSAVLGEGAVLEPLDLAGADLYLGISVAASVELSPRLPVTAVPFSLAAAVADLAADVDCAACIAAPEVAFAWAAGDAAGGAALDLACSDCISTGEIANGAVALPKISACNQHEVLNMGASGWECDRALDLTDATIGTATIATATVTTLNLGADTQLVRGGADLISTPDALTVGGNLTTNGTLTFGAVTLRGVTGTNPGCGTDFGHLSRLWSAKTCGTTGCNNTQCTTAAGWSGVAPTCEYVNNSNPATCTADTWTRSLCINN